MEHSMSYPVTYKGVTINVEKLDDVAELVQKLTAEENPPKKVCVDPPAAPEGEVPGESLAQKIVTFWRDLGERERTFLTVLAKQVGKIGTDDLVASTGIAANDLKYAMKRIAARAKPHGINGNQLVESKANYKKRPVKSTYTMQEKMKKAILEMLVWQEEDV
jgi:hypothetical protein